MNTIFIPTILLLWIMCEMAFSFVTTHSNRCWQKVPDYGHRRSTTTSNGYSYHQHNNSNNNDNNYHSTAAVYTSGVHHVAIRTKDIDNAIKFYSLLNFEVEEKYMINGEVRAAWMSNNATRIEFIEIPERILGAPKELVRAADQMKKLNLLGLNHICLDVTQSIRSKQEMEISRVSGGLKQWYTTEDGNDESSVGTQCEGAIQVDDYQRNAKYGLQDWLLDLEELSKEKFEKTLRIAVEPTTRTIGYDVFDIAFIYDPDGALVELLNHVTTVKAGSMRSSWNVLSDDDFIALLKKG